jgi:AAA15 family ATPase/GTPase
MELKMYLSKATFRNVQGFENLTIDFMGNPNNMRMSSLFLGNNSAGKSAFLRSLALGMCDETGAAGLIENFRWAFIRQGEKEAIVNIEFMSSQGQYCIVTAVKKISTQERLRQQYYHLSETQPMKEISPEDFPWQNLFVCGYGAGRLFGESTKAYEKYRIREAITTLFRYDYSLLYPELSLHRLIRAARKQGGKNKDEIEQETLQRFLTLMGDLFMLTQQETIELTESGIEIVSEKKRFPLLAHGDGYKNTATWVLDMVSWKMLAAHNFHPQEITGIVLLDEVEQHLHPRWQRHIVRLLRQQFPKIQWIMTTHSPLCAAGIADLPDEECQLLRFNKESQGFIELMEIASLRGLKADQVLTSAAFGLDTTRNPEIAEKLDHFSMLYLKESRTSQEEQEFIALRDYLDQQLPEPAEDSETRVMQHKLKKMLGDLTMLSSRGTL